MIATQRTTHRTTEVATGRVALSDGARLFYRHWQPAVPARHALVLLHRGHEHSGRLEDVVTALGLADVAVFAWDARGHGHSDGARGQTPSFARLVRDLEEFTRHIRDRHGFQHDQLTVLGHSVGAVIATTWVHDYAPRIAGLVLVTPAFAIRLYVPFAIPGLRALTRLRRGRPTFIKSFVSGRLLTHDRAQAARYDTDPLISRDIPAHVLVQMRDAAQRVVDDAAVIRVPTLVLTGGADWVVRLDAQRRFFGMLGASDKHMRVFDGLYHDLLHERDRAAVLGEIRSFVDRAGDRQRPAPLLDADCAGPTHDEHAALCLPLPVWQPRRWGFALQSLALRTVGRLSTGIRLGLETGFDSGQTLDYVYADRPRGALGIGRWIDRAYLNSIGWRGIRERKRNIDTLLEQTIAAILGRGETVRILDIATGVGRAVLDAMRHHDGAPIEAVLRDNVEANLARGRAMAAARNLTGVRFDRGDAFDPRSLAAVDPAPNLALVSGLYELFPANEPVRRSLRGVAAALRRGTTDRGPAFLVYTGQPWHPQLETIARVLDNRDGEAWCMRRRSQEELDDLVADAGFEKIDTRIDDDGIFTVSLARLVRP